MGCGVGFVVGFGLGSVMGGGLGSVVVCGLGSGVGCGVGSMVGFGLGFVVGGGLGSVVGCGLGSGVGIEGRDVGCLMVTSSVGWSSGFVSSSQSWQVSGMARFRWVGGGGGADAGCWSATGGDGGAESFPGDDSPIDAMAFISADDDRGLVLGHAGGVRVHERILH